jgi:hypothetical protein
MAAAAVAEKTPPGIKSPPRIKPVDFCIMLIAAGLTACSFLFLYGGGAGNIAVKGEDGAWIFPADSSETLMVAGPLGETVVEIKGGKARIVSSPCANQTCVAAGAIHAAGQWTACLPNRVMVSVERGRPEERPDASAW